MIVSTMLAQKKVTCQWMDPSNIDSDRNPHFIQQLSMEVSLSLRATVIESGGISTMPTKILRLPVAQMLAPPSTSPDGVSDRQILTDDWLSCWSPRTRGYPTTRTMLSETEGTGGSSARDDCLMASERRLNGKLKGVVGELERSWSWRR
jgi:hypothetical protein